MTRLQPLDLVDTYATGPGRLVRGGMVLSADGAAVHDGTSRGLSTAADRAVFRALRAVCDVVLVGAGTARAEAYGPVPLAAPLRAWREERGLPAVPALAVVSRRLDLPPDLVRAAVVVTCASAPHEGLPDVVVAGGDRVDLADALDRLADRGLQHVLCEGGPALLGDLVAEGLLDELCATVSPRLAGAPPSGASAGLLARPLPQPLALRLLSLVESDGTLLLRWGLREGRRDTPGG